MISKRFLIVSMAFLVCGMPAFGQEKEKVRLAFVSNNSHAFWTIVQRGCDQAAKDYDVDLEFRRPVEVNWQAQKKIVDDLLARKVQGIAICANDPLGSVDFLKVVAGKVPLVATDNDLPDPSARRCYIGTNNYRMGRAAGELVKSALPKGGKFAIFVGSMDAANAIERRQGILDFLAGKDQREMKDATNARATNLKVGEHVLIGTFTDLADPAVCERKSEELLKTHPDVACLVGLWEYNPPALLRAVRGAKSKTAIVGFDENLETLKGIQKGEIAGTIVQNPYRFGYESIGILADLARKKENVLRRKDLDKRGRMFIPVRMVRKNQAWSTAEGVETLAVDIFIEELKKMQGAEPPVKPGSP